MENHQKSRSERGSYGDSRRETGTGDKWTGKNPPAPMSEVVQVRGRERGK
jgi:hypothetical protein